MFKYIFGMLLFVSNSVQAADLYHMRSVQWDYTYDVDSNFTVVRAKIDVALNSCGAFFDLDGAPVVLEVDSNIYAGYLTAQSGAGWYLIEGYETDGNGYTWKIKVKSKAGQMSAVYFEITGKPSGPLLTNLPQVDVSLDVDNNLGFEVVELVDVSVGNDGSEWAVDPALVNMACLGSENVKYIQEWNNWGWTKSTTILTGHLTWGDCSEVFNPSMNGEPVYITLNNSLIFVPAGDLQELGGTWHRYIFPGGGHFKINVDKGYFNLKYPVSDLDFLDVTSGVDVVVEVGDRVGVEFIPAVTNLGDHPNRPGQSNMWADNYSRTCYGP